jgi:hypothetical protein
LEKKKIAVIFETKEFSLINTKPSQKTIPNSETCKKKKKAGGKVPKNNKKRRKINLMKNSQKEKKSNLINAHDTAVSQDHGSSFHDEISLEITKQNLFLFFAFFEN